MTFTELKANELRKSKGRLRKRLTDARNVLTGDIRRDFRNATFDFEAGRLIDHNGIYYLQWVLRDKADEPISYNNQQTLIGNVHLRHF